MIFVDGVGLGEADPTINPLVRARTPAIRALLGSSLAGREAIRTSAAVMVPLDARLGVPGLPQSATGQVALLTGDNAPALVGRHITAYPTPTLAALLQSRGLFAVLRARGVSVALANAYSEEYYAAVAGRKIRHAAITLNALQAGVGPRAVRARIRADIPPLDDDRSMAGDVERILGWMKEGELVAAAERAGGPLA